ncbi:MAG: helix-hairpin-helix domain-containing protein [Verrucomicrobiales bacterium]
MNLVSSSQPKRGGSVLIIVLWVAFGLVSMALYFANSMSFELRAADNRLAILESEQAIEGAIRYMTNLLANLEEPGTIPEINTYLSEAAPVGDAMFWILGPDPRVTTVNETYASFGLADESSKLNINTATRAMLELLPGMTPELAAAIIDWRDDNQDVTDGGGAEDDTYAMLPTPYHAKNASFETLDELRMVAGAELNLLYGEDANLNGILDFNENDADISPPFDNRNGRLDAGLFSYLTVYTQEPNTRTNGSPRINVNTQRTELRTLLEEKFGNTRAQQVVQQVTGAGEVSSILHFYLVSGLTVEEFAEVHADLTTAEGSTLPGRVNINTAPEAVLAAIPGIGIEKASSVVAIRQSNADKLATVAWLSDALERADAILAGPYITARTYQYNVDIAAVGRYGRGYRRTRFVVDTSSGTPVIRFRQDLSDLGWALGQGVRQQLAALANKR